MLRTIFLLLLLCVASAACTCVEVDQRVAFKAAYAVFQGTVTKIHHFESEDERKISSRELVTFRVSRIWKGPARPLIDVHARERALMCDSYRFEQGATYVVYAVLQDKEGGWADRYPAGTKILFVGDCILRIRIDIADEARRLGSGRSLR